MSSVIQALQRISTTLRAQFLDKDELSQLMIISAIAGEHMLLLGPPGTAKSALVRSFAALSDARYFEYLLTRFTEPNELFGPVNIKAFREGVYTRNTDGMLPEAEIVFLDEIFKSNSAILNSLLTLLNERRYNNGGNTIQVPLRSVFGASNEVPSDEALDAIYDRFLLRAVSNNLDSFHFQQLIAKGLQLERRQHTAPTEPLLKQSDFPTLQLLLDSRMNFDAEFLTNYKNLVFQIRAEGIKLSDRRIVKLLKLFAASALLSGRDRANAADLFLLKHIWNKQDQRALLEEIVEPVLVRHYQTHPDEQRLVGQRASLVDLANELRMIREVLLGTSEVSDIQLFGQLENLNALKAALISLGSNSEAKRLLEQTEQLLQNFFAASRFA